MSTRVKPAKVQGRELVEERAADPDGRPVLRHRVVNTLERLLRRGVITDEMYQAAKDFEAVFIVANLDPLRALPILRVPGTGREPSLTERQALARKQVHDVMQTLGGYDSPGGSVVWHVVGGGLSLRAWAMRQRWGGRAVRPDQAQGALVAALSVLARQPGRFRGGPPARTP